MPEEGSLELVPGGKAADPNPDLNLMPEWREPVSGRRILIAAAGSVLFHIVAFTGAVFAPGASPIANVSYLASDLHKATPLYMPKELTQRDPNAGKISKTLDVRSAPPPAPVPQAPHFQAPPRPAPSPSMPSPAIEPPKIEASAAPVPAPSGGIPQLAPPVDKPKLAFENIGAQGPSPKPNPNPNPNLKLPDPKAAMEEAMKMPPLPSQGSGGITIGDIDEMTTNPSPNQTPSNGPVRSNLQLLSDPKGVDFKPYLIQVLTAVRSNWLSVIPESARMGRRGRVLVQFIIDRRGGVPKLVIAESSGTSAFDRAAVAGISASNPFPPLPTGFQGAEIRLQLAFTYNMASR